MILRRSLATAVLASLLLSSCADDEPKPDIPPPTTTPPSTSATTEPVDPLAYPAEAMEPTKAGAEVLIRHYYDMFNQFLVSGDATPVRRLYGDACDLCEIPIGVVELAQSKGHTYEGSEEVTELTMTTLRKAPGVPSELVRVDVQQSEIVERDKSGKVINRFPSNASETFEYQVSFQDGRWGILSGEVIK